MSIDRYLEILLVVWLTIVTVVIIGASIMGLVAWIAWIT